MKNSVSVSYSSSHLQDKARSLARQLGLHCVPASDTDSPLQLNLTDEFIELRDNQAHNAIHVDFIEGSLAHRKQYGGGRGQAIAKAIGLKPGTSPPTIIDATAGLGKDAFVLACLGCPVTMVERSAIVATLVTDAIQRAMDDADFQNLRAHGFDLIQSNARDYLQQLDDAARPDVIYLDPMYPEKKKSALVKKNMQILQKLLGQDEDTDSLLTAALNCARKRVVVKRPKGAIAIAGPKPTMAIDSKKTRYDVYVIKAMG
ncbi:MAG: class I SAM-dependent methyltransferase [Gammaproteobacteria bacterium]|nr:class I SAM-dependent methyltransferase [Gammaproteobacteria bacterium]